MKVSWKAIKKLMGIRNLGLLTGFLVALWILESWFYESRWASPQMDVRRILSDTTTLGSYLDGLWKAFRHAHPFADSFEPGQITSHLGHRAMHEPKGNRAATNKGTENTPLEFHNACEGFSAIWSLYTVNEVQGFLMADGRLLITAVGSAVRVTGPKPILFRGIYYFPWDKRYPFTGSQKGVIDYPASHFIFAPIVAMFHTHVMSGSLSAEDKRNAITLHGLKQLLFEQNRISEFDENGIIVSHGLEREGPCAVIDGYRKFNF